VKCKIEQKNPTKTDTFHLYIGIDIIIIIIIITTTTSEKTGTHVPVFPLFLLRYQLKIMNDVLFIKF